MAPEEAIMDYSSAEIGRTNGGWLYRNQNQPYCKQSPYWKCWEEAPWSALTGRESHLEMKWQVNSENNDIDTQTSDSKHT